MSVEHLTPSAQNYVKIIWGVQEWADDPVTPGLIASRAGVAMSSVSDAVRKLAEQGLVSHTPYGAVSLTEDGQHAAVAMVRRHRLLETFLVQVLGYTWDEVHDEAEVLEHAVTDRLVDRIDAFLDFPTRDPHGDPIPSKEGHLPAPDAAQLSTVEPHGQVVVERISDDDPALLQFFTDTGIGVGTRLTLSPGAPFSETMCVTADGGEPIQLGRSATDAVWVSIPQRS